MSDLSWVGRRDELRRGFDDAFAEAPPPPAPDLEDLVLVRVGPHALAVRVSEIAGLEKGRKIVPLPGSARELLGLAGVRGQLVPVFSLAALLGLAPGDEGWFVLCGRGPSTGLAFAALEGCVKVPRSRLETAGDGRSDHVAVVATIGTEARGVLDTRTLLAAAAARVGSSREG